MSLYKNWDIEDRRLKFLYKCLLAEAGLLKKEGFDIERLNLQKCSMLILIRVWGKVTQEIFTLAAS